jgi:hypothetical protein
MAETHPDKDAPHFPSQITILLEVTLHQGSLHVAALLIAKVLTEKILTLVIIDRKDFFDILEFAKVTTMTMANTIRIMVLIIIVKVGLAESCVLTDILYVTHPITVVGAPLLFTMNIVTLLVLIAIALALVLAIMALVLGIIMLILARLESTTSLFHLHPIIPIKCSSIG